MIDFTLKMNANSSIMIFKLLFKKFTNADNSPTEIPFYRQSNRVMHLGSVAFKESREDAAVKTFTMESIN